MRPINPLKKVLLGISFTPKSESQKVLDGAGRVPVDRQAARMLAPVKCWTSKPLDEKPSRVTLEDVQRVEARLKMERNSHAETSAKLGQCREKLKTAQQEIASLKRRIEIPVAKPKKQPTDPRLINLRYENT